MGDLFLGRYEIDREVGQGGMASVYRGADRVLGRDVAIKVLHPHLAQRSEAKQRFAREARVIARLRHPNIVEVYDYAGEESERAFIITEFIDGFTLAEFLERHQVQSPELAASIVASIARALAHAHERGVIHRDIKPENIMVRRDGLLKLTDFGIAHVVDMEHLTMTGVIIGSPAHMSPEQVDGSALDARTDVFSLGTLLFLTATGDLPFKAETASALLKAIAEARVPDVRARCPGFPDDLYRVLVRMMARDPEQRIQSAAEVADSLESITAAVGLGAPAVELPRFFADPDRSANEARLKVAAARLGRARDLLRQGRHAIAIRELDCVISADPANEEAKKCLDRTRRAIKRRNASRVSFLVAAGLGIVLGLAFAASSIIPEHGDGDAVESGDQPAGVPALVARPAFAIAAAANDLQLRPRRGTVQVPAGPHRVKPGPDNAVTNRNLVPVVIQANPPAVRISIDGRGYGEGTTGEIALVPGRHSVHLSHPSCEVCRDTDYSINLDPNNPPKAAFRFSIGYRDALLVVRGQAGARVLVNGIPRGRTNEVLRIPMSQPSPVQTGVTVLVEDQPPKTARVTLEAGRESSIGL